MADWEHKPDQGAYEIIRLDAPTLVDRFEDHVPVIRQKSSTEKREFVGVFTVTDAEAKTQYDLYATKLKATSLTILTFDPKSATPDTDAATVYFVGRANARAHGTTRWKLRWHFIEA